MSKTVINIVLIVLVATGLFFGYNFFFGGESEGALLTTVGQASTEQNAAGELLAILKTLEQLTLDASFLETSVFKALRDFSVALPESVPGRRNPFAPLGQ
ncbi:MAG: hypothetical protein HY455_01370 [Parcubacteria group bacterium]|nr:hypothetical protein [Parcubacteria group bacterium]